MFTDADVYIKDGWEHTAIPQSLIEKYCKESCMIMQLLNHARHCDIFSDLMMCFKEEQDSD